MFLRSIGTALLAGLLCLPGTVQAGHGGGGGHGGGYGGGHAYGGYGGHGYGGYGYGGYGHGYAGYGYHGYGGYGYFPYYGYGYGLGYRYYPNFGYGYYGYSPYVYGSYYPGVVVGSSAFYPPVTGGTTVAPAAYTNVGTTNAGTGIVAQPAAMVEVHVPANAQVWIEGDLTRQQGAVRVFKSPPLQIGKSFSYDVKARWMENGKPVEREKQVHVEAGELSVVNFTTPATH